MANVYSNYFPALRTLEFSFLNNLISLVQFLQLHAPRDLSCSALFWLSVITQ